MILNGQLAAGAPPGHSNVQRRSGDFVKSFLRTYARFMAGMALSLLTLFCAERVFAEKNPSPWSVFAYGGPWTKTNLGEIVQAKTDFKNSFVWAVGGSRTLYNLNEFFLLEAEVNTARHTGRQDHFELNAAVNLRLHRFPWDRYVNTSLAYGLGPSYAFTRPPIEQRRASDPVPSHLLVFMPVEVTFAPPDKYQLPWEVLVRVHHRSGAFGAVSNAKGSNFIVTGLRYRF